MCFLFFFNHLLLNPHLDPPPLFLPRYKGNKRCKSKLFNFEILKNIFLVCTIISDQSSQGEGEGSNPVSNFLLLMRER